MDKKFRQQGLSLIEIILYISLSSFILLTTAVFSMTLLGARTKNQTIATVDQEGSKAMSTITQTIRNATSVNIPPSPAIGSSGSTLSVNTGTNDPTVFALSSGVITMQQGSDPQVALTSSRVVVSNLTFTNLSQPSTPNNIKVSFTVTHVH